MIALGVGLWLFADWHLDASLVSIRASWPPLERLGDE
jgi:hypothetical protein